MALLVGGITRGEVVGGCDAVSFFAVEAGVSDSLPFDQGALSFFCPFKIYGASECEEHQASSLSSRSPRPLLRE